MLPPGARVKRIARQRIAAKEAVAAGGPGDPPSLKLKRGGALVPGVYGFAVSIPIADQLPGSLFQIRLHRDGDLRPRKGQTGRRLSGAGQGDRPQTAPDQYSQC